MLSFLLKWKSIGNEIIGILKKISYSSLFENSAEKFMSLKNEINLHRLDILSQGINSMSQRLKRLLSLNMKQLLFSVYIYAYNKRTGEK